MTTTLIYIMTSSLDPFASHPPHNVVHVVKCTMYIECYAFTLFTHVPLYFSSSLLYRLNFKSFYLQTILFLQSSSLSLADIVMSRNMYHQI